MPVTEIPGRVRKIVEPILSIDGIELLDIEYRRESNGWVLRLYIDKEEGGVTVDDCTKVSREAGRSIDIENIIEGNYTLEVSSPGLTRPLRTERDFMRYQNRLVSIVTVEPIRGRQQFKGRLLGMGDKGVEIEVGEERFDIPFPSIARAKLELDF